MYGVIDIGSNTIRMMIYNVDENTIRPVLNNKYLAGLAGYVSRKGELTEEGVGVLLDVLKELRTVTEQIALEELFPFATASLRNITNTKEVLRAVKSETGFDIRVLSGDEEALFDYYGAIQRLPLDSGILADVGGGSTELVFFRDRAPVSTCSLPIGSLNLYTKFVDGIIPSRGEIRRMEEEAEARLKGVHCPPGVPRSQLCTVGGTARAVLKLHESLNGKLNGSYYSSGLYGDFLSQMAAGPERLIRQMLKTAPERIHTLTPGIVILNAIAENYGIQPVITSSCGVREGYLYYTLKERGIIDESRL